MRKIWSEKLKEILVVLKKFYAINSFVKFLKSAIFGCLNRIMIYRLLRRQKTTTTEKKQLV